ncbi:MAG: FCD domain-containing protein [Rhodospirillales bacterium]
MTDLSSKHERPDQDGALTQMRAFLAQGKFATDSRLPPERELCGILGVTRNELRRALATLEREGVLWRHVGKGTFIGMRPVDETASISAVAERTSPSEVMTARRMIEPLLAREAALNAAQSHLDEMRRCVQAAREALTWRQYETCDNRFHRTVAEAAGNNVLTALFDQLNAIRRTVVWGRVRDPGGRPPADHHSFAEHDRLLEALIDRDPIAAERAMEAHLDTVENRLRGVPVRSAVRE